MAKRKKSFYIRVQFVRRLKGFEFWRLSIYHKSRMVKTVGFFDHYNNLLFLNFNELLYFITRGLDFKNRFDHSFGKYLKNYNLGAVILISMYNWFNSNKIQRLNIPKRFWFPFFKRTLKIIYYCLFRELIKIFDTKMVIEKNLSKIITKRFLIVKRLSLIKEQ